MILMKLSSRYDVEEGFQQTQSPPLIQISSPHIPISYSVMSNQKFKRSNLSKQKQQAKLKFISIEREISNSSNYHSLIAQKQLKIHKSLTLEKDQFIIKKRNKNMKNQNKDYLIDSFKQCIIPNKRSEIGENIILKDYTQLEVRMLKEKLLSKGAEILFENKRQQNSHGMLKRLMKLKNSDNFLKSKYNRPLIQKINESAINPKTSSIAEKLNSFTSKKTLQFVSDFQSANLDFVTQINSYEYDLYLKADTNTLGHQNWFYFKLFNHSQQNKNIFINICNLKRSFKLIKKGQKIFQRYKRINNTFRTSIQNQQDEWSSWQKISEDVTISLNQDNNQHETNDMKMRKMYKLSFAVTLISGFEYEYSLLPPFTYSEMLKHVEKIQSGCQNAHVQILSFSLIGVAIPIITFTRRKQGKQKKNLILVSSRIHPGETCASYVAQGLINKLSQVSEQVNSFLQKNIVKIIPMLNPDGVILGNFRTNYLGNDLNRSFNKDSQTLFPQISALRELGTKLKHQFGERFLCFLDLHGHSSQKNIFTYGPEYEPNHRHFNSSRFIPKALQNLTKQFNYNKCTFRLEESKLSTARGFFLSKLKVMAFTIQSSYTLYDNLKDEIQVNLDLKIQNLQSFGSSIINCLYLWTKFFHNERSLMTSNQNTSQNQSKNMQNELILINKIKKQLKIQSVSTKRKIKITKDQDKQSGDEDDSDAESQSEDITLKQRQKLERRLIQKNSGNFFPRILHPAIIHPEVSPPAPIFSVSKISSSGQKGNSLNSSIINARIRRKKLNNVRAVNVNNVYTQYLLKEVKGLEFLKPNVDHMKIVRKQNSIIASLSQMSK